MRVVDGAGDPLAAEQACGADFVADLYRRYRSPLVWYLRSCGATDAEAHDAVQEAFVAALRTGPIDDPGAWYAWLRTVAMRCLSRARSTAGGGGRIAVQTMAPFDLPDCPAATSVDDAVEARSRERFVLDMLAALPPRQRIVFCLHLEGLSMQEIAAELGAQQPAVRKNLSRARRFLRELISQGEEHES